MNHSISTVVASRPVGIGADTHFRAWQLLPPAVDDGCQAAWTTGVRADTLVLMAKPAERPAVKSAERSLAASGPDRGWIVETPPIEEVRERVAVLADLSAQRRRPVGRDHRAPTRAGDRLDACRPHRGGGAWHRAR